MAVAHDAASESATSSSVSSFSWTHTPVGTPAGVLVFTFNLNSATHEVSSVTYNGVNVPAVSGGEADDTANEPGSCKAWFLGSGVPSGAQTVQVNRTNNTNTIYAIAITVTAAGDVEVTGVVLQQENQAPAEASVNDGSPGTNSLRYAGAYCGAATVPSPGANSTALHDVLVASTRSASAVRETTAGQGARSVGYSAATDDWACVALAIREIGGTVFNLAVAGAFTPAGALVKGPRKALAGASTPAGVLIKSAQKIFSGTSTPSGALVKRLARTLIAAIAPAGALQSSKVVLKALTGAVAPGGALRNLPHKILAGDLSLSGALRKRVSVKLVGALAPIGALIKRVATSFAGALSAAGSLIASILGASVPLRIYFTDERLSGAALSNEALASAAMTSETLTASALTNETLQ